MHIGYFVYIKSRWEWIGLHFTESNMFILQTLFVHFKEWWLSRTWWHLKPMLMFHNERRFQDWLNEYIWTGSTFHDITTWSSRPIPAVISQLSSVALVTMSQSKFCYVAFQGSCMKGCVLLYGEVTTGCGNLKFSHSWNTVEWQPVVDYIQIPSQLFGYLRNTGFV